MKHVSRVAFGLCGLLFASMSSAAESLGFTGDQPANCETSANVEADDRNDENVSAATTARSRGANVPVKTTKSQRPKWKALLPGAIK